MIKTTLFFSEDDFFHIDCDLYGEEKVAEWLEEKEDIKVSYGESYGILILESNEMLNFSKQDFLTLVTKSIDWDMIVNPISINIEF